MDQRVLPILAALLPERARHAGCCGFAGADGSPCTAPAVDRLSLHLEATNGDVLQVLLDDIEVCDQHFHLVAAQMAATYPLGA